MPIQPSPCVRKEAQMDIGEPERIIEVEPEPVEVPEPVPTR